MVPPKKGMALFGFGKGKRCNQMAGVLHDGPVATVKQLPLLGAVDIDSFEITNDLVGTGENGEGIGIAFCEFHQKRQLYLVDHAKQDAGFFAVIHTGSGN